MSRVRISPICSRPKPEQAPLTACLGIKLPLVEAEAAIVRFSPDNVVRMPFAVKQDNAVVADFNQLVAEGRTVVSFKLSKATERLILIQELGGLGARRRCLLEQADGIEVLGV